MDKILKGVNILDVTEGVAGPYAATLLADMGASVIKVERPEGDWARLTGKPAPDNITAPFLSVNRNKRNICLDLQKKEAGPVARRLVAGSDAVISNFRKGVMDRMGLSYAACREINPKIIYCTISAFGQKGPYSELPASDTLIQALSGIMDSIGEPDGPPLRVSFPLVDFLAAGQATQGILLGLYRRDRGGKTGMWIDISLINIALSVQTMGVASYLIDGELSKRCGNQNPMWSPGGAFRTKDDKYLSIVVLRESHWEKFCQAIGRPRLPKDGKFKNNSLRIENRAALNEILNPILRGKKREEWVQIFKTADVLCAPVNTFADIMDDAALCESLSLLNFNLMGRPMRAMGNPMEIDGEYPSLELPACRKGENTVDILNQLGFDDAEIQNLIAKGVAVRCA